ncbi:hypothetical protein [Morganella morganii]|uniref:hypothetical protein n=1 Tax=Morganella morganii TaxID=582 RepID=UPI0030FE594B
MPISPSREILLNYLNKKTDKIEQRKISSKLKDKYSLKEAFYIVSNGYDVFEKDSSITKKTSLSFIIEYLGFRGLFLGDAHEEDIYSYLNCNNKTFFNVVKLSHHGGCKNTSSRLIKLFDKDTEYIICADKTKNNHPNNLTIARIVLAQSKPTINLSSCNYDLRKSFEELKDLGFDANITYAKNGVNTLNYE